MKSASYSVKKPAQVRFPPGPDYRLLWPHGR